MVLLSTSHKRAAGAVAFLILLLIAGLAVYLVISQPEPGEQRPPTTSRAPLTPPKDSLSDQVRAAPSLGGLVHLPPTGTPTTTVNPPSSTEATSTPPPTSPIFRPAETSFGPPIETLPVNTQTEPVSPSSLPPPPPPPPPPSPPPSPPPTLAPASEGPETPASAPSPSPAPEQETTPAQTAEEQGAWQSFKVKYNRTYNPVESLARQAIFLSNLRFINDFNRQADAMFKLDVNHFADKSRDEINAQYIGPSTNWSRTISELSSPVPPPMRILADTQAPNWIDWRPQVTSPVDQGTCRDSSVFAVVGALEAAKAVSSGAAPQKLSLRQVFECLDLEGPTCTGDMTMMKVFQSVQRQTGGLASMEAYEEYLSRTPEPGKRHCGLQSDVNNPDMDSGRVKLETFSLMHRDNMIEALTNNSPLVVAIDASQSTFHFYKSGLYHDTNCSQDSYNQHVLLIGHQGAGFEGAPADHFVLRNSFGPDWGEAGLMRMLKDEGRNKCLPQQLAILPVLSANPI